MTHDRRPIVSRSEDGQSTLVTSNGVSRRIDVAPLDEPEGFVCEWPAHVIAWDDPGFASPSWTASEPAAVPETSNHVYLGCVSDIVAFFGLLLAAPPRRFTPVLAYGRHVIMGPRFDPHTRACPACFAMSLLTNLPSLRTRWQERHRVLFPAERRAEVQRALEALILLREVDAPRVSVERVFILDLATGSVRDEAQVLRVCGDCARAGGLFHPVLEQPSDLVGEFVGAVRWIEQVAGPPRSLAVMAAHSEILDDRDLGGGVDRSREPASRKALFETIERAVTNHARRQLLEATALDPDLPPCPPASELRPYSQAQYDQPEFPLSRYQEGARYLWLTGARVRDGAPLRVPADFVFADPSVFEANRLAPPSSTGTAAFDSPFRARQGACLELVERDIVTRCWYRRALLELPGDELVPDLVGTLASEGTSLRLWLCDDIEVAPVVVAAVFDPATQAGALGCAAGVELSRACCSAVFNAATMLAHRSETSSRLELSEVVALSPAPAPRRTPTLDWDALVARYDPVVFALAPELLQARNIHVTRAWSARAVGFMRPRWPLPLARWSPDATERAHLADEIGAF